MLQEWQLLLISLTYIGLLFGLASFGKQTHWFSGPKSRSAIYALTLAIYCSSWSLLGMAGETANAPFSHLPIYLGPMLVVLFGWPLIQNMIRVSLRLKLTSIADLISARFGYSRSLAALIVIIAVIGTMPYMALQLNMMVGTVQVMLNSSQSRAEIGFILIFILTFLTLLFNIQSPKTSKRYPGLMLAIAAESLLKLSAFLIVSLFIILSLFSTPATELSGEILSQLKPDKPSPQSVSLFIGSMLLTMAAFLCLPRQFHVMVVECQDRRDTQAARWLFPLYLSVFMLLAAPIGIAGEQLLAGTLPAHNYMLYLPHFFGQTQLSVLAYIGALSAATSMMLIAALALATMLHNELLFPFMFKRLTLGQDRAFARFCARLLSIRKLLMLCFLGLGYLTFLMLPAKLLPTLGPMAFGMIAQLAPGLLAALYWRRANHRGVSYGLLVGLSCWLACVLLPSTGISPQPALLQLLEMPTSLSGSLLSLMLNIITLGLVSAYTRPTIVERIQADQFLRQPTTDSPQPTQSIATSIAEMQALASRFIGEQEAKQSFSQLEMSLNISDYKPSNPHYQSILRQHSERLLSRSMGTSSAKLVLNFALQGRDIALTEMAQLIDEASSERKRFGRTLLQSAIENAGEGISVINDELHLVAWNKKYVELFNYPEQLMKIGTPIAELIRYNLKQGVLGEGEIESRVQRRINHLRRRTCHSSVREFPNHRVIHIQGNPMPLGGFVMTFSDITAYRDAEQQLRQANLELEDRVVTRTQELVKLNHELELAKYRAEQANQNKSDALRNCSHDLMQPLEAARLFTSTLSQQPNLPEESHAIIEKLTGALNNASDLVVDMSEVARIESGRIRAEVGSHPVQQILGSLQDEFNALADHYQVEFHVVKTQAWIETDPRLLRRVFQNLLANAFRYATGNKVLLGCRRQQGRLLIQLWDTGPGIPKPMQEAIFDPFTRLHNNHTHAPQGLGLGLSIAKGLCQILDHDFGVESEPEKGAMFYVSVPVATAGSAPVMRSSPSPSPLKTELSDLCVLCVDNDPDVLQGMVCLLSSWGCEVLQACGKPQALEVVKQAIQPPQIMLVDYQLDHGECGLALMQQLQQEAKQPISGILLSADSDPELPRQAQQRGYRFMPKMIKPAKLRALISSILADKVPPHPENQSH